MSLRLVDVCGMAFMRRQHHANCNVPCKEKYTPRCQEIKLVGHLYEEVIHSKSHISKRRGVPTFLHFISCKNSIQIFFTISMKCHLKYTRCRL